MHELGPYCQALPVFATARPCSGEYFILETCARHSISVMQDEVPAAQQKHRSHGHYVERQIIFDAISGNDSVDGFSGGYPVFPKSTKISSGLHRYFLSSISTITNVVSNFLAWLNSRSLLNPCNTSVSARSTITISSVPRSSSSRSVSLAAMTRK